MTDYNSAAFDWSNVLDWLVHHESHRTDVFPCPGAIVTLPLSIISGTSVIRAVSFDAILCMFKETSLEKNSILSGLFLPEGISSFSSFLEILIFHHLSSPIEWNLLCYFK